ncbi:unnamed protein product [Darwinula stevensoni]|uniref:Nucleoside diphosphate kinase-like domain-containing protein n=1 Tax=Darwinula stevensoni TaxID=69355 RepID=A0A7R9FQ85_9CRUS|nr:unnamed protein product [Darwinula stevensoni]CAG0899016.1 unnamed protein product [Darwinula stevensoni]
MRRKEVTLTRDEAAAFYAEHEGKPFYEGLVEFMTSGPIVVMALARKNAVKHWRTLLGPTNTAVAKEERPDSIRAKFGSDGTRNAAHGSDSTESANRELQFFFPELTLNEVLEGERRDNYLDESLNPILMKGLYAVSKERPENPVAWLADWLLANNPGQASS